MKQKFKRIIVLIAVVLMLSMSLSFAASAEDVPSGYFIVEAEAEKVKDEMAENLFSQIGFFSLTEYEECYGDQLDGDMKGFYDAMVEHHIVQGKTDPVTYTLSDPITFEWDQAYYSSNGLNGMPSYEAIKADVSYLAYSSIMAFIYDYPEMFWVHGFNYSYSIGYSGNVGTIGTVTHKANPVDDDTTDGKNSIDNIPAFNEAYEKAFNEIKAEIGDNSTRAETLKIIHDYICEHSVYAYDENGNPQKAGYAHSPEGFFINNGAVVCEGYAETFKMFCDDLNIPCALIIGYAGEDHMWNYVQMEDGKWYLVDVTWDDQDKSGKIYDTYFLANSNTVGFNGKKISEERTEKAQINATSRPLIYPVLSDTAYEAHTHTFSEVVTGATCNEGGYTTFTCDCGATYTDNETEATGHLNTEIKNEKAATCGVAGYTGDTWCKDCGNKIADGTAIPATGEHTYEWKTVTPATCGEAGSKKEVCSVCEADGATGEIPATGEHTYEWKTLIPATCGEAGSKKEVCSVCEADGATGEIPATGAHTGGEATCVKEAVCDVCKQAYGSVNSANHKTTEIRDEKEATCGAAGYSGDIWCKDCGNKIADGEAIEATGDHKNTEIRDEKAATCGVAGYTGDTYCKDCGNKIATGTVINATGNHDYKAETVAPTCTEKGYTINTCSVCKNSYKSDEVAANGHTMNDENICSVCGYDANAPKECDHICHQGGFMGFIWKIINFFQSLFGINDPCKCGAPH